MIYLDHSATTAIDKKVFAKMQPYFLEKYGNASSIHSRGMEASQATEEAREQIANFLNTSSEEIIFTSGATESDNLAVFGVAEQLQKDGHSLTDLHFVTTSVEHPAVEEPFLKLKKQGAQVTFLPVQSNGVVDMEEVEKAIQANTVLVSMVYVNSEVGSRQPIEEVGKLVNVEKNKRARKAGLIKSNSAKATMDKLHDSGVLSPAFSERADSEKQHKKEIALPLIFHTDAVQAANFFTCDVEKLQVDLLSLSGHKIYGPKGVGALYVRKGTKLVGQQIGGHQENNLRSGTYNVPAIVGMGEALTLVKKNQEENNKYLKNLQTKLISGIKENIKDSFLNTDVQNSTPAHVHFAFPGAEGEAVLMELDMEGICISTGSACASTSLKSSPTLSAMGVPKEITHGAIRMTLGLDNTEDDVDKVLEILPKVIAKYRAMSPKGLDYGGVK